MQSWVGIEGGKVRLNVLCVEIECESASHVLREFQLIVVVELVL